MNSIAADNHKKGTVLVACSGLMYGVIGYFGTTILDANFSVTNMLFWRFFIAFIGMALIYLWSSLYACWSISETKHSILIFRKRVKWKAFVPMLALAIVSYCGSSLFYFLASVEIGTGVAMVIFFAYPIFVVFFSWLKGIGVLSKQMAAALSVVLFGLYLLKDNHHHNLSLLGLSYALLASFSYGVYVFFGQFNVTHIDSKLQTLILSLGNALLFFVLAYADQSFETPRALNIWWSILGIAIIGTALPIQFMLDGLKYISAIKASILSVLEPITTVVIGFMLLNETLSLSQTLGIFIVLCGALMIQFEKVALPVLAEDKKL